MLRSAPTLPNLLEHQSQDCHVELAIIFWRLRTGQVMHICAKTSPWQLLAKIALEVLEQCPTQESLTREIPCTTMVTFKNKASSDEAVVLLSQETCQSARKDQRAVLSTPHSKRGISHSINEAAFDLTIRYSIITMPHRAVKKCWTKVKLILESIRNKTH